MDARRDLRKRLSLLVQCNDHVRQKQLYRKRPIHAHIAKLKLGVLTDKRSQARIDCDDIPSTAHFKSESNLWPLLTLGTFQQLALLDACVECTPAMRFTRFYYDIDGCQWFESRANTDKRHAGKWIEAYAILKREIVPCQSLDWWFDVGVDMHVHVEYSAKQETLDAIAQATAEDNPFGENTRNGTPLLISQYTKRSLRFKNLEQWRVDMTVIERTARLDVNGSPEDNLDSHYLLELSYDPLRTDVDTTSTVDQALVLLELLARALASSAAEAHEVVYDQSAEWTALHDYI